MIAIRKKLPEAKVMILTRYAGDVEGALKLGARAYLQNTDLDTLADHTSRLPRKLEAAEAGFVAASAIAPGLRQPEVVLSW